jgi:hypothetical protein
MTWEGARLYAGVLCRESCVGVPWIEVGGGRIMREVVERVWIGCGERKK